GGLLLQRVDRLLELRRELLEGVVLFGRDSRLGRIGCGEPLLDAPEARLDQGGSHQVRICGGLRRSILDVLARWPAALHPHERGPVCEPTRDGGRGEGVTAPATTAV